MKRLATVSLAGALVLSILVGGVAAAYQTGAGSQWQSHPIVRTGGLWSNGLRGWAACTLSPTISGTSILSKATPGKAGGSLAVEVVVRHPDTSVTPYTASGTANFPSVTAGTTVTLTRVGTSYVLTGTVTVPSGATSGEATLVVSGDYGLSAFTCNLTAKITVPLCTEGAVWAYATPAMPGGTLWVAVGLKKPNSSATLTTVSATATIPGAATSAATLAQLDQWPVLVAPLPVGSGASLGQQATVTVSGTYTVSSVATAFTCTLSTPIKNIQFWPSLKGSPKGH
ncbi:MAG: hypothetical protein ACLQBX_06405 [Candidatus Limnocylindrales bacterium]|jgi:hypothetical protein